MKKQVKLDDELICQEYLDNAISVESLAKKYHVGKLRIKDILEKNNISIKKRGAQKTLTNLVVKDWKIEKYPSVVNKHYVVTDPRTNFSTTDIKNTSGVITSYIKKEYSIPTPTLYDRRKYYMETGNYWWEQWLTVSLVDNKQTKKCPYCAWETVDVQNKSGAFFVHLLNEHGLTKSEYLQEHPEDIEFATCVNPLINRQFETDNTKFVTCKVCGKKLARIDNHHLQTHNITKIEYVQKFGDADISSKEYHDKQSKATQMTNMNMTFTKKSKAEKEIEEFVRSLGFSCNQNRKILKGQEIDIFIPEKNIGIEYNGNVWHTEWFGGKDKNYHLSKLKECQNNNIGLITIFEDEYMLHKDIVLNKIAHILHAHDNTTYRIYARKCQIKEIYTYQAKDFLDLYHIQGHGSATVSLGAFYDNKLIGVMQFLKLASKKWELTRFATDINYVCCGVGGKLFAYFIRNYDFVEIKSFADRRWTINVNDNVYTKLGFQFAGYTKPNYTYYNSSVDRYKRIHKFNFRKANILRHHPEIDKRLTETEMVKLLGYDRIWDCGLIKYVYVKNG